MITCPHCKSSTTADASFCEGCGRALSLPGWDGPRIAEMGRPPATSAGQMVRGKVCQWHLKRAGGALLAVAILQTVGATLMVAMVAGAGRDTKTTVDSAALAVVMYGVSLPCRVSRSCS